MRSLALFASCALGLVVAACEPDYTATCPGPLNDAGVPFANGNVVSSLTIGQPPDAGYTVLDGGIGIPVEVTATVYCSRGSVSGNVTTSVGTIDNMLPQVLVPITLVAAGPSDGTGVLTASFELVLPPGRSAQVTVVVGESSASNTINDFYVPDAAPPPDAPPADASVTSPG